VPIRPRRTGCSINAKLSAANITVTASRRVSSAVPVSPDRALVITPNTGQCHRYSPYETRPISGNGGTDSSRAVIPAGTSATSATTAATDTAASSKPPRNSHGAPPAACVQAHPVNAAPASAAAPSARLGTRACAARRASTVARSAPTSRLAARVSVPKYARPASAVVAASTADTSTPPTQTTSSAFSGLRPRNRTISRTGHSR
jgi:hypothetical protein